MKGMVFVGESAGAAAAAAPLLILARIADVATELGVTPRTLRFWESQGLLTSSRSLRRERVYSIAEREQARLIAGLRDLGMSIDDIRDMLERGGSSQEVGRRLKAFLTARIRTTRDELERLQVALQTLEAAAT